MRWDLRGGMVDKGGRERERGDGREGGIIIFYLILIGGWANECKILTLVLLFLIFDMNCISGVDRDRVLV